VFAVEFSKALVLLSKLVAKWLETILTISTFSIEPAKVSESLARAAEAPVAD